MKDHAAAVVSDEAFAQRAERWRIDTPDTKEAYFIREIFEGTEASVPQFSSVRDSFPLQLTSRLMPRPRQPYGESSTGFDFFHVLMAAFSSQLDTSWRLGLCIRPKRT